jgi:acetyltransferase-like isoleucine patch superfamily enzyme
MKKLLLLTTVIFPQPLKRLVYTKLFGYDIARDARIGFSYLSCKHITLASKARIGHGSVIKGLDELILGTSANIGHFNFITAMPSGSTKHFLHNTNRVPALKLGNYSSLTGRHYLDCCDTITIGAFTIVAGMRTSFFTHGIDLQENRQDAAPITIGNYCMIGATCVILKGAVLPDYSVLGANSTLQKAYAEPYTLYSGVPAMPVRQFSMDAKYFSRTTGFIA